VRFVMGLWGDPFCRDFSHKGVFFGAFFFFLGGWKARDGDPAAMANSGFFVYSSFGIGCGCSEWVASWIDALINLPPTRLIPEKGRLLWVWCTICFFGCPPAGWGAWWFFPLRGVVLF